MCVFLCLKEGSDNLKNSDFRIMSDTKRQRHLAAILRHRTAGTFSDETIGRILSNTPLHKQHSLSVLAGSQGCRESTEQNIKNLQSLLIAHRGKRNL